MREKFKKLSRRSFVLALGIFVFSFFLYHYVTPEGAITLVFQQEPGKPMVTLLWSVLGTCFLFSSILSSMIARIFFPEKT